MNYPLVGVIAAALSLAACVSPEVVSERKVNDASMSCQQIGVEMGQIDEIRKEARKGKTASGTNIAAVLLFWPAAIGNYANATEALEAAAEREAVLVDLSNRRGCK